MAARMRGDPGWVGVGAPALGDGLGELGAGGGGDGFRRGAMGVQVFDVGEEGGGFRLEMV